MFFCHLGREAGVFPVHRDRFPGACGSERILRRQEFAFYAVDDPLDDFEFLGVT